LAGLSICEAPQLLFPIVRKSSAPQNKASKTSGARQGKQGKEKIRSIILRRSWALVPQKYVISSSLLILYHIFKNIKAQKKIIFA
jgi:hypothetical protein